MGKLRALAAFSILAIAATGGAATAQQKHRHHTTSESRRDAPPKSHSKRKSAKVADKATGDAVGDGVPSTSLPGARDLIVNVGDTHQVMFPGTILSVSFGDPHVATVKTINERTAIIAGKSRGQTRAAIFVARSPQDTVGVAHVYNVTVVPAVTQPRARHVAHSHPRPRPLAKPLLPPRKHAHPHPNLPLAPATVSATVNPDTAPDLESVHALEFDLELVPVADTKTDTGPEESVWVVAGRPMTAFKSLASPTLRAWVANLPPGTSILWQQPPSVGLMQDTLSAHLAEFSDFSTYCMAHGVSCTIRVHSPTR